MQGKKLYYGFLGAIVLCGGIFLGVDFRMESLENTRRMELADERKRSEIHTVNVIKMPTGLYSIVNPNSDTPWRELESIDLRFNNDDVLYIQNVNDMYKLSEINVHLGETKNLEASVEPEGLLYTLKPGNYIFFSSNSKSESSLFTQRESLYSYHRSVGLTPKEDREE